jgi:hypothetical protein
MWCLHYSLGFRRCLHSSSARYHVAWVSKAVVNVFVPCSMLSRKQDSFARPHIGKLYSDLAKQVYQLSQQVITHFS